jgi:hypothetical protein
VFLYKTTSVHYYLSSVYLSCEFFINFSVLSTQLTLAIPLTMSDHNGCAIECVLEFHAESFERTQEAEDSRETIQRTILQVV